MNSFFGVFLKATLCGAFFVLTASQCAAQQKDNSAQARPCGTSKGFLSKLIPQGWKGASFRSACVAHDDCYDSYGEAQATCDNHFRDDLIASCESSRRPRQCKRVAKLMYNVVDQYGQNSFHRAQEAARVFSTN